MALLPVRGFRLTDIACFGDGGGRIAAVVTFENQSVIFDPGDGSFVNCLFRLEAQMATVRATVLTDAEHVEAEFVVEMQGEAVELAQGEVATDRDAPAGLYRMALLPVTGFQLRDIDCYDVDNRELAATVTFENQSIAFSPGAGGVVNCTFRLHAQVATVTVTVLTDSPSVDHEFAVEMGRETVHMVQGVTAIDRSASADGYHMALQPVPGLRLMDIVCLVDDDTDERYERVPASVTFENQSIAFEPGVGEVIDCTFRLQASGSVVTATVLTDIGYVEREFTVEMEGEAYSLMHGQTATSRSTRTDRYRMSMLPAPGFQLTDIICVAADDDHPGERLPANITFENQSIAFAPGAGRFVNCVFRLQAMPDAAVTGASATGPAPAPPGDCCSCQVTSGAALQAPPMLPCTFDLPAGWKAGFGNDGSLISAIAGAQCGAACRVSPSQSFSVATGSNRNAETMEEIWSGMMKVVGTGSCGDRGVTFFESPGSDPNGQLGAVQFHVGFGGKLYSANATFTCPVPGEWQNLRDLFIGSFRSNPGSTFGED